MSVNDKNGKSKAGTVITCVLAAILIICTGLAIWTSINVDAQMPDPLAFIAAKPKSAPERSPEPSLEPTLEPAPVSTQTPAPQISPDLSPDLSPKASPEPSPETGKVEIVMTAIGDITMGTEIMAGQRKFDKTADDKGLKYFFSGVYDILSEDDLTIGNLEGPLTTAKSYRKGRPYIFKGKPEYAKALVLGSVEAVTVANNHARDFFRKGQKDTQKALDEAGITWFGFSDTAVYEVKGVKIGLLGVTEWDYKEKGICDAIKALKEKCDMVIVEIHWGAECRYRPTKKQKRLGRAAIDAGADAVFGHHTHVVGAIELYNDRPIVYSLGNFCFAGNTDPQDKDTFIYRQTFLFDPSARTASLGETKLIPCSVSSTGSYNDFKPTPLTGKNAKAVIEKIRKASKGFEKTLDFNKIAGDTL